MRRISVPIAFLLLVVDCATSTFLKKIRLFNVAMEKRRPDAFLRPDPNYTRLMFAPSGRPLRRGDGYFFNHYVSLAPKVGLYDSGDVALSTGVLYMRLVSFADVAVGMSYVVGTKGSPDKSFTCGLGLGYIAEEGEDVDFAEHPVILLGGNIRLSESMAIVSENWLITGQGLGLSEQPLGLALRFFGQKIAIDAGAIIIGEIEGFPIPWLSFVYNFGD